jgi:hypothetical protein
MERPGSPIKYKFMNIKKKRGQLLHLPFGPGSPLVPR